jgi:hypothetical protein
MTGTLTPAEQLDRQRADHRMIGALDASPEPIFATGHRSAEDVRANQNPVRVGDRTPPSHYRVVYDFETLSGPGRRHHPTVVHVAPLANGAYPATPPSAWVISDVVPWTPHFAANVPICHGGHVWASNKTQLVDYVVHIGKLLNFDEPPPIPGYHGYNREAVAYWRDQMHLRPLDSGLRLPTIRAEDVIRRKVIRRVGSSDRSSNRFQRATPNAAALSPRAWPGGTQRPRFTRAGGGR